MKTPTLSLDSQFGVDKNKKEPSSNEETRIDDHIATFDECEDSNQTLDLFKIYRPLIQAKFDNGNRKPSFLERSLFPGFSRDITTPASPCGKGAKEAQLTIFYNGEIYVYNDVPYEKAQAIMLLAEESSNSPKAEVKKAIHNQQSLPSFFKLQEDLPIARKSSLKRFLEKRRERLSSKSPYPFLATRNDEVAGGWNHQTPRDDDHNNMKLQISPLVLLPFPSRFGNSFNLK